jgi:hypothetical protein
MDYIIMCSNISKESLLIVILIAALCNIIAGAMEKRDLYKRIQSLENMHGELTDRVNYIIRNGGSDDGFKH